MSPPPPPPPLPPASFVLPLASDHPPPPPPPLPPFFSCTTFSPIHQPSTQSPLHSDVSLDSDDARQQQTSEAPIPSSPAPPSSPAGTSLSGDDNEPPPVQPSQSLPKRANGSMVQTVLPTENEERGVDKEGAMELLQNGTNETRVVSVVRGKGKREVSMDFSEELERPYDGSGYVKVGFVEELPDEEEVERRKNVEKEVTMLLEGRRHGQQYSDWGREADDALSLEELQLEADEVTRALDGWEESGLVRAVPFEGGSNGGDRGGKCRRVEGLRKRVREVVEGLADVQMMTAGRAAEAEIRIGCEQGLKGEVAKLKITLNHLARLTLEQAQLIMDRVEGHA